MKIALAALVAGAVPATANAAVIITSHSFSQGSKTGMLHYTPTGTAKIAKIGRFSLTGTNQASQAQVEFLSYCFDIFDPMGNGGFALQSLSTVLTDPIKLSQINAVLSHGDRLAVSATASAAVQMAIWEILYEAGTSGYNVGNGLFYVTGGTSDAARMLANAYLNSVVSGRWKAEAGRPMAVLAAPGMQTQLVTAAIPEPATWAMMIGGFALVGGGLRRGRKGGVPAIA